MEDLSRRLTGLLGMSRPFRSWSALRKSRSLARAGRLLAACGLVAAPVLFLTTGTASAQTQGSSGGGLGGYTVNATSAAERVTFNIPGLVPISYNLMEVNVPYANTTVDSGPIVDALGSPLWPGYPASDLGTEIGTLGGPSGIPNNPVRAEAQYPATPQYGTSASFPPGPANGASPAKAKAASVTSKAGPTGGSVSATTAQIGFNLPAASAGLIGTGSLDAASQVTTSSSAVTASATSSIGSITIAGIVHISGLSAVAEASSNGTKTTPKASLHVGAVTVDGHAAYLNGQGIQISGKSLIPSQVPTPAALSSLLSQTLSQDQITVKLLSASTSQDPTTGATTVSSGGIEITIKRTVVLPYLGPASSIDIPQVGNEGLPTDVPTVTTVVLGDASVTMSAAAVGTFSGSNSSSAPASLGSSTGSYNGSSPASQSFGYSSPSGSYSMGSGAGSYPSSSPMGAGSSQLSGMAPRQESLVTSKLPGRGFPVPIGWVVTGILASIVLSGPFLFYSRWQLLVGRHR
ncbi:MAG: hypothetical protein M1115_00020 [Actinobacteria bacterium]|nr:hypothetical protein [Actinomycetota bacterium]